MKTHLLILVVAIIGMKLWFGAPLLITAFWVTFAYACAIAPWWVLDFCLKKVAVVQHRRDARKTRY